MALRVLHLSTYAGGGGAARAAATLNQALQRAGIDSRLACAHGNRFKVARAADRALWRLQSSPTQTWRSPARFGSLSAEEINSSDADVVNLHWVTDGFLSIKEISRITKPLVWTLYDMWPFCGTEHYGVDTPDARWRTGYSAANRPSDEKGLDIDRYAWEAKMRDWKPAAAVPASTWLTKAASESTLMGAWPITRIPHIVDTDEFRPASKSEARRALRLPLDVPLVLFLASAGITDRRKGFDLLERALPAVADYHQDLELIVAGPSTPGYASPTGVPIRWQGSVINNAQLVRLYAAADVLLVPSRVDNMPLTAMEAQSCGCPVVAFDIGGLPDIVLGDITGLLVPAFDIEVLANAINVGIDESRGPAVRGLAARHHAVTRWSPSAIVPQYQVVYETTIS